MISPGGYARLLTELDAIRPRIICHPEDEEGVRQAVAEHDSRPQVEVTEMAKPGEITMFRGHRWPVADLGTV